MTGKGYRPVIGKIVVNKIIDTIKDELDAALSADRSLAVTGKRCRPVIGKIVVNKNIDTIKDELDAALSADSRQQTADSRQQTVSMMKYDALPYDLWILRL